MTGRRRAPRSARARAVSDLLVVAAFVLVAVIAYNLGGSATAAPPAPAPAVAIVETGTVTAVPDGATVVLGSRRVPVLGLSAPTGQDCGAQESADHARTALLGKVVTLVPDPSLPATDPARHVVSRSQLSYTDDAIVAGVARVAPGPWWYRDTFTREQRAAVDARAGLWRDGGCWSR